MTDAILVINAGSSSIKFAGYTTSDAGEPELLGKGQVEGIGTDPYFVAKNASGDKIGEHDWPRGTNLPHSEAIRYILEWISSNTQNVRVSAVGHRVVFGGANYTAPIRLNDRCVEEIETLIPFFPLHLPHNLAAIRAMKEVDPGLPQIACFDNAFHRTLPPVAQIFALPWQMTEQGIRRYGFHGLSYEYIARKLPQYAPGAAKVVVAHLGSGASMCAILDGESIESTLGFSGLDGLPMGTRTGVLDPGVLLYLMQARDMDAAAIEKLLYKQSGLLGVSGVSNDMRDLLASEDPRARQAIELFCYHAAKNVGALAAALEGLDALVFTAGVGENAPDIRERICRRAAWLGIHLDDSANRAGGPRITTDNSPLSAWVIPTDEEKMIAIHTQTVLSSK